MKHAILPLAFVALLAPLTAQTTDLLGGTTTAPVRTATGKSSVFRVDSSVLISTTRCT